MEQSFSIKNLKESNDFLNILLDNISSAIFIVDKAVRIQNVNNAYNIIFSKNDDQVLGELCGNAMGCVFAVEEGKDCGTTSHCSKCGLRDSIIKSMLQHTPCDKKILERDFYIQGGKISKYFLHTNRYIQYKGDEMVLVILDDVSDIEKQRRELQKKNELLTVLNMQKNELLGVAAHDLRNPVGVMGSYADIIIEMLEDQDTETRNEYLEIIRDTSEFALGLLNDILDISKIESGKLTLTKTRLNYIDFVEKNIKLNRIFASQKNIELQYLPPQSEELLIEIDTNKVEQVLNNLISNAIKYSYPDTTIKVLIEQQENLIVTHIIDQGQGIPASELDSLFKAFTKTSVQSTAGEKSTGLGLAIAKKIVEGHGGKILVKSKVGEGSDFYFSLRK